MYKMKNSDQFMRNLGEGKILSFGTNLEYPGTLLGTLGYLNFFEHILTINLISLDEKLKLSPENVCGIRFFWSWKPIFVSQ